MIVWCKQCDEPITGLPYLLPPNYRSTDPRPTCNDCLTRHLAAKPVPVPDPGRQRVIDVFGDHCPVCYHSIADSHTAAFGCIDCGRDCSNHPWPPESIQIFIDTEALTCKTEGTR